jgi:hypothetical protein
MRSLLDILLTHFYAHVRNGKAALPAISQWVYESMAGHRFLPQEIMACFWILMLILLIPVSVVIWSKVSKNGRAGG